MRVGPPRLPPAGTPRTARQAGASEAGWGERTPDSAEVVVQLQLELPVERAIALSPQGEREAGGHGGSVADQERTADGQVQDVHAVTSDLNGVAVRRPVADHRTWLFSEAGLGLLHNTVRRKAD